MLYAQSNSGVHNARHNVRHCYEITKAILCGINCYFNSIARSPMQFYMPKEVLKCFVARGKLYRTINSEHYTSIHAAMPPQTCAEIIPWLLYILWELNKMCRYMKIPHATCKVVQILRSNLLNLSGQHIQFFLPKTNGKVEKLCCSWFVPPFRVCFFLCSHSDFILRDCIWSPTPLCCLNENCSLTKCQMHFTSTRREDERDATRYTAFILCVSVTILHRCVSTNDVYSKANNMTSTL